MFNNRTELIKLVGTIAILFAWVILFGSRADDIDGKLLVGSMLADIVLIVIFRLFAEIKL